MVSQLPGLWAANALCGHSRASLRPGKYFYGKPRTWNMDLDPINPWFMISIWGNPINPWWLKWIPLIWSPYHPLRMINGIGTDQSVKFLSAVDIKLSACSAAGDNFSLVIADTHNHRIQQRAQMLEPSAIKYQHFHRQRRESKKPADVWHGQPQPTRLGCFFVYLPIYLFVCLLHYTSITYSNIYSYNYI